MEFNNRGIIKRILQDHFSGFGEFHQEKFPESYRKDIEETIQKNL